MSQQLSLRELTELLLEAIRELGSPTTDHTAHRLLREIASEQKLQTQLLISHEQLLVRILEGISGGSTEAGTPGKPTVKVL